MFINGLKYVKNDQSIHAYKFALASGRYRNLVCFYAAGQEVSLFQAALLFALYGEKSDQLKQAIVYFSDDNGDHWILDRRLDQVKIFKNKQEIQVEAEDSLRKALLEWSDNDNLSLHDHYEVSFSQSRWYASRDSQSRSQPSQQLFELLHEKIKAELYKLSEAFEIDPNIEIRALSQLFEKIQPAYFSYKKYTLEIKCLEETYEKLGHLDVAEEKLIKRQVRTLDELASNAQLLLDPSHSPTALRARYQQLEGELSDLLETLGLEAVPKFSDDTDWSKLIALLTRYQAFQRLDHAYRRILEKIDHTLRPSMESYVGGLSTMLSKDRELLVELEMGLTKITDCVNTTKNSSDTRSSWRPVLEKWLNSDKPTNEFDEVQKKQFLQDSRESVDTILRQLGSLHASCHDNTSFIEQSWDEIRSRHEKLLEELSSTKDLWHKSAKALGLDPNCSLKKLLSIIQGLSRLRLMEQEQENLRQRLNEYKEAMRQTAVSLKNWYKITGSQKQQIDLRQASIIQSEARNVLSYLDSKKKTWQNLIEKRFRFEAFHGVRNQLEAKVDQAKQQWNEAFTQLSAKPPLIDKINFDHFLPVMYECMALSKLGDRLTQADLFAEVVKNLNLDTPLSLFSLTRSSSQSIERNYLLNEIEHASPHGYAIFLHSDPALAEAMAAMGIALAQRLELRPNAQPLAPLASKQTATPVLSERARVALEMFKGRQQLDSK